MSGSLFEGISLNIFRDGGLLCLLFWTLEDGRVKRDSVWRCALGHILKWAGFSSWSPNYGWHQRGRLFGYASSKAFSVEFKLCGWYTFMEPCPFSYWKQYLLFPRESENWQFNHSGNGVALLHYLNTELDNSADNVLDKRWIYEDFNRYMHFE